MTMTYRPLGKSALRVSALCLGTMMFGDRTDETESRRILDHAREAGVNFLDTADVYTQGASETLLGRVLQGQRRHWVLASKLGNPMGEALNDRGFSRRWVLQACEDSLRRLQTDHLDVLYLHRDFNGADLEEPLRALEVLLRDGKIRAWGVSNFRGWRIAEAAHLARALNMPGPAVCQPYYNLLNRMPEVEVLPACVHHGLGVVPYSPVARGILSGKYLPGVAPPQDSRVGRQDKRMMQTEYRPESLQAAAELAGHCRARGISLPAFATAWVLANRAVSSVIAGPRTLEQWLDYLPALGVTLDEDDEALVDRLVPPGHPSSPGFTDPAYPLQMFRG